MGAKLDEDLLARLRQATSALDEQLARSSGAVEETLRLRRRSRLLRGFLDRVRADPAYLPRHCSWCGRIEVDGEFVPPEDFLAGDLPERLRLRATHGICPDCLESVQQGRKPPARNV
ncbi:MAG TPA: hypothetical protein VFL60_04730 [Gaiellaceae bacterium]|nr:hypothetical protein [Gaiellaceae bacterium]